MVETVRGRNGGIKLNKEPVDINIGDVVRYTETDFFIAECFKTDVIAYWRTDVRGTAGAHTNRAMLRELSDRVESNPRCTFARKRAPTNFRSTA